MKQSLVLTWALTLTLTLTLTHGHDDGPLPYPGTYSMEETRTNLLKFYTAFDGPDWFLNTGWTEPDTDPCCRNHPLLPFDRCETWYGVLCKLVLFTNPNVPQFNTTETIVSGLFFDRNTLQGSMVDPALGEDDPNSPLCHISPSIQNLGLLYDNITGAIPTCLKDYALLNSIYFAGLNLDPAPLPVSITTFPFLNTLSLSDNKYEGPIPAAWESMKDRVSVIDVSGNTKVNGTIPHWVGDIIYLTVLSIRGTQISGTIPPALLSANNLQILDLSQCNLEGTIPDTFYVPSSLLELDLSFNNLEGTLPPSLGRATQTYAINITVTENLLSGSLDLLFLPGSRVNRLDVSANFFNGTLSPSIGNAVNMSTFSARANFLSGTIPAELCSLQKLSTLDLGENAFTHIHPDLKFYEMSSLKLLSLRDNSLCIPPSLFYLYSYNPDGSIISKSCSWKSSLSFIDISRNLFSTRCNTPHHSASDVVDAHQRQRLGSIVYTRGYSLTDLFLGLISSNIGSSSALTTCVLTLNERNNVVNNLIFSGLDLTGPLPTILLSTFNRLVQIDLSHNRLSGKLPSNSLVYPFYLPTAISYVDLSNNQLEDDIPLVWGLALVSNLRYLDLTNNPITTTSTKGVLPSFLVPDWSSKRDFSELHIFCPGITNEEHSADVLVDNAYFRWFYCRCSPQYYGRVGEHGEGCTLIPSFCTDQRSCAAQPTDISTFTNDTIPLIVQPGYWPAPSFDNVQVFIPCSLFAIEADQVACNPFGNISCLPQEADLPGVLTCGPESSICRHGSYGKFCSRCIRGYFPDVTGCQLCPDDAQSWFFYVLSYIGASFALITGLSLRSQQVSVRRSKLRALFHASPSISRFAVAYWPEAVIVVVFFTSFALTLAPYEITVPSQCFFGLISTYYVIYSLIRRSLPPNLDKDLETSRNLVADDATSGSSSSITQSLLGPAPSTGSLNSLLHAHSADPALIYPHTSGAASSSLLGASEAAAAAAAAAAAENELGKRMGGFFGDTPVRDVKHALAVAQSLFKSFLVYFQTLEAITFGIVSWDDSLELVVNMNEFVLTTQRLTCRIPDVDYSAAFLMVMYTPLLMAVLFLAIALGARTLFWFRKIRETRAAVGAVDEALRNASAIRRYRLHKRSTRISLSSAFIALFYIMYFPASRAFLSLFSCARDDIPGHTHKEDGTPLVYLLTAPYIQCYSGWTYWSMFLQGGILYVLYTFVFFYCLYRVNYLSKRNLLHSSRGSIFSILFESYRPGMATFEKWLTARRLGIAFIVSTAPITAATVPFFIACILALALFVNGWYAPFSTRLTNFIEGLSLVALIATYILTRTLLRFYSSDSSLVIEPGTEISNLRAGVFIITGLMLSTYFLVGIIPFVHLFPALRRRNFVLFRQLGLGRTHASKSKRRPLSKAASAQDPDDDDALALSKALPGGAAAIALETPATSNDDFKSTSTTSDPSSNDIPLVDSLYSEIDNLRARLAQTELLLSGAEDEYEAELDHLRSQLAQRGGPTTSM